MKQKNTFIEIFRKNFFGFRVLRSIYRKLCFLGLPLYMYFDPLSIKDKWYNEIKGTQIKSSKPLFIDRQAEIEDFFKVSKYFLLTYYLKHGSPNTERFKEHYLKAFAGNVGPDKLKEAYDKVSFDYTLRLMLAYERYSLITGYLDFLVSDSGLALNEFDILDYGCGVSDIGLLFCSFGANVTICDLDNERFDFVVARFKRRGYKPKVIRIIDTETYPELFKNEYDLIIATELFEHVRNPLRLLENFINALKGDGYLFDSMAGDFQRDDRPHHLKEAFRIGRSQEYTDFHNNYFVHLLPDNELRFLFKKR